MNYYHIEPEVAGSLGEQTVIDTESWPPKVSRLEYQFDGWLGDELLVYCFRNKLPITCKLSY
ncbi:hypothetical protein ALP32_02980 [Pseudomonas avellanae]|uniref:Uncharacterized protein n=1 Tax=Pseudomonas avellanae TaxID=46257 RepID=A0A3M5U3E5_9PSED|nr:hypothetical protein ALP32_02980 [Pseudomonas avellanae]GGJ53754.1 hypothetical protein GCM10009085_53880 [Pseudomonas avellanae]